MEEPKHTETGGRGALTSMFGLLVPVLLTLLIFLILSALSEGGVF